MGLSKRFTVACVLSLATSALLFTANPVQADPSLDTFASDAQRFVDQSVAKLDITWDNVNEEVHEVLEDLSDSFKSKIDKATDWVKTLTHESFPGVQLRLKEPKLCDPDVKQVT